MYQLIYGSKIKKDLRHIPQAQQDRLFERMTLLASTPRHSQVEKLTDMEGYRLRVGDYRVLFTIDDHQQTITIYRIQHRRDVYR